MSDPAKAKRNDRRERLRLALRENLKRRKSQARGRAVEREAERPDRSEPDNNKSD
jgi:hypothetical protein